MDDWTFPKDLERAKVMLKRGYSIAAVAMQFGATGTDAYYDAYTKLGFELNGRCPHCGAACLGTGDCNCLEE